MTLGLLNPISIGFDVVLRNNTVPSFKLLQSGAFVFIMLTYTPTHIHTHTHRDKVITIPASPYYINDKKGLSSV